MCSSDLRSFTVLSPTQLQAVVGMGASGSLAIVAQGGVGFSSSPFMFTPTSVRSSADVSLTALPNPASSEVLVRYSLPSAGAIKIDLYSMLGEHIATLDEGVRSAGTHTISQSVEGIAQGVYSCRLQTEQGVETLLLRVVK